jgi:hypothetical protein
VPSEAAVICVSAGLVEILAASARHALVSTAEMVDAGDVAHQLARAVCPLLPGERGDVALDRGIEVDASAIVKQTDGSRPDPPTSRIAAANRTASTASARACHEVTLAFMPWGVSGTPYA